MPQQLLPDIVLYDISGQVVDLAQSHDPIPITEISRIEIHGTRYILGYDAWLNPELYLEETREVDETYQERYKDGAETAIALWEAAIEGEEQVRERLGEELGAEVARNINSVIEVLEQYPVLQDNYFRVAQVDLWELAGRARDSRGIREILSERNDDSPIPACIRQSAELSGRCEVIMRKIVHHGNLTEAESCFVAALSLSGIAISRSIHGDGRRINEYTRPYVVANMAERLICREIAGRDIFEGHQQQFAAFCDKLGAQGYEIPEWITPYRGDELLWGFSLSGHKGDPYTIFIEPDGTSESIGLALNHERLHVLDHQAGSIGYQAAQSRMLPFEFISSSDIPREHYDETYTQAFALLIYCEGNVEQALAANNVSWALYKSGVRRLLMILQAIEVKAGVPLFASRLMMDGLKAVATGTTRSKTDVIRQYYDEQIGETGSFAQQMERYADQNRVLNAIEDTPEQISECPVATRIIEGHNNVLWDDLADVERERFGQCRDAEGYNVYRAAQIRSLLRRPDLIFELDPSPLVERVRDAVLADDTARREIRRLIASYYQGHVAALRKHTQVE
jgi:hypothetical protein